MTTKPDTFPQKVTACYVTSDQKLHTSAEAADVHQAKLNAEAVEAARRADLARQEALIMQPLRRACQEYNSMAIARYRDTHVLRPEVLKQVLEFYGLKLVSTE